MLRDPYRHLFLEANLASHRISKDSTRLGRPDCLLSERLDLRLGSRLLLAGLNAPEILPALRLRLGLTGQLMIADHRAEALSYVSRDDAFWAVVLKARTERLPIMDSSLDAVLCWSSFMDLGPLDQTADEFFRVLAPGGRVFVTYLGPRTPDNPWPCLTGLERLFIMSGFSRLDSDEAPDFFLFQAEKVAGFDLAPARMGRA
jgi:SAM-dependent methyltransferase